MKEKLIILSDIFGTRNSQWIQQYYELLSLTFNVRIYDILELAGIENDNLTKDEIHKNMLSGGIDMAVQELITLEEKKCKIIGFSMGGIIAWKAILSGLPCEKLILVSSTRIRYETEKPSCEIKILFGEEDIHQPDKAWFENMEFENILIKDENHEFYRNEVFFERVIELVN